MASEIGIGIWAPSPFDEVKSVIDFCVEILTALHG